MFSDCSLSISLMPSTGHQPAAATGTGIAIRPVFLSFSLNTVVGERGGDTRLSLSKVLLGKTWVQPHPAPWEHSAVCKDKKQVSTADEGGI